MPIKYDPRGRLTGSLLGSTVSGWGRRGLVKSIQRGTIYIAPAGTTATATITAVDPNNSELHFLGQGHDGSVTADFSKVFVKLAFTSSTVITALKQAADAPNGSTTSYEVIEYYPGVIKSVQRGTISTGSSTVTAVNTAKSALSYLGHTYGTVSTTIDAAYLGYLSLASSTSVTGTNANNSTNDLLGYQLVEYF